MQRFREELQKDGIETDVEVVEVPIRRNDEFLQRGLQVLRLPEGADFLRSESVVAGPTDSVRVTLDLRPRVQLVASERGEEWAERAGGQDRAGELRRMAAWFDWEGLYFDALDYKRGAGLDNLAFTPVSLRRIFEEGNFEFFLRGQSACGGRLWRRCGGPRNWPGRFSASISARSMPMPAAPGNRSIFAWPTCSPMIRTSTGNTTRCGRRAMTGKAFAQAVRALVKEADKLYRDDLVQFPRIRFDRHLYQPLLLVDARERYDSTPPGLNEGGSALRARPARPAATASRGGRGP